MLFLYKSYNFVSGCYIVATNHGERTLRCCHMNRKSGCYIVVTILKLALDELPCFCYSKDGNGFVTVQLLLKRVARFFFYVHNIIQI